MATASDYITTALRELGIVDVTETPGAELSSLALGLINRILDDWNADRHAVYADVHSGLLAFTANLNPHTVGISGNSPTWAVTGNRPVSIEGIRLTADNGETYLKPLTPRDSVWWHHRSAPGTTSDYPTDYYYDPTWPNGSIYFYPEPASASIKAQLWYRVALASLAASDTVMLPPGYQSALTETLKERLTGLPMFASLASASIADAARVARARAFGNNVTIPPLCTADAGIGTGGESGIYLVETGPYSLMGRT